jgi:hypothetical protein
MSRPGAARALAGGLLGLAVVAACTAGPGAGGRRLASSTATARPSDRQPARLAGPAAPPYRLATPPPGPAGRLATWSAPAGRRRLWLQVWFSGVQIGRADRWPVVAYASLLASSDGRRTVLHAKVAVFRCATRAGDGSPNFGGCRRRSVEYGDLARRAVPVDRPDGQFVLAGRFPTYVYRGGVDRDPRVRPRWTGRTYLIRIDVRPAAPADPGGVAVAVGTVTLGSGATAVTTTIDAGYPNRIVLADPPATRPTAGRRVPG